VDLKLAARDLAPVRPAFYALRAGGWRDYLTLLHPPYTLWHLSYVVWGFALAGGGQWERLAATLAAFFLAVGVAAHVLDELHDRPLRTQVSRAVLATLAVLGLGGAVALGIAGAVTVSPWLLAFVVFGAFIALAYNLEWAGGRFHTDAWFALAWGSFPLVTAYYAAAEELDEVAALGALMAFLLSLAQRTLSSRVRALRRRTRSVEGEVVYADGKVEAIDRAWATSTDERALLLLSFSSLAGSLAVLAIN
jgi:4-hydroxybenzoate polyprenyltransferase